MPAATKNSRILLEDVQGRFEPDLTRIVTESEGGRSVTRIPGKLSCCGVVNGNNRRYSRRVWEENLKDGSTLRTLIEQNAAFGLLEHPADGKVDLNSPISHSVVKVYFKESTDEIHGEIAIVDCGENSPGRKLKTLIEMGYNPTVSSRGFGSLIKAGDGVDEVQEDYVCEGWDVVIRPSFKDAVLNPQAIEVEVKEDAPVIVKTEPVAAPAAPKISPVSEAKPAATKPTPTPTPKMELKQLRESIAQVTHLQPSRLSPAQFAEGLARMAETHNDIAKYQAEDATRSWEATRMHSELTRLEESWSNVASAPAKQAKSLSESNAKLIKVVKAVAQQGVDFKKKLTESAKKNLKLKALTEEVAKRGKGWKARCEAVEAEKEALQKRYGIATEALDIMAERYKTDVCSLGKALIEREFGEKAQEPEIIEALKKAKVPKDLVPIREKLEGKKPEAEKVEEGKKPETEKKPEAEKIDESKKPEEKKPEALKVEEAASPNSFVNESVLIARRLSKAVAA